MLLALAASAAAPDAGAQTTAEANGSACPAAPVSDTVSRRAARADSSTRRDTTGSAAASAGRVSAANDHPTVVLFASASAREVRFATQPRILVRLCGAVTDSVHVVERRNLPDPVQPGVTYKDVYIAVEIMGHLNAECLAQRIVGADSASRGRDCAYVTVRDSAATPRRSPP